MINEKYDVTVKFSNEEIFILHKLFNRIKRETFKLDTFEYIDEIAIISHTMSERIESINKDEK